MRHDELADLLALRSLLETCQATAAKHELPKVEYFLEMAADAVREATEDRSSLVLSALASAGWRCHQDDEASSGQD